MLRTDSLRVLRSACTAACACLAALVLLTTGGCGSGDPPMTVTPAEHDFGRVMLGETRKHRFKLRNNGTRTVAFRAKANCACLAVAQSLKPLDPGKELDFTVIFTTKSLSPKKITGKYVTISTDHPDQPEIIVPLTGEVFRAYDLRPALFEIGRIDGRPKNYEPLEVVVRPLGGRKIRFEGIIATPDVFDVESEPLPGGTMKISLRLRKGIWRPLGDFLAQVRLKLTITNTDGRVRREEPIVKVHGFWAIPRPK